MIFIHNIRYSETNEKAIISSNLIYRIISYFKPYRIYLILSIISILIISALGLAPSMLLKNIIDEALPKKDFIFLTKLVGLSMLSTVSLNFLQVGQSYLNITISKKIILNLKNQMYEHLQNMSLQFFSTEKSGEITTRIGSDIDGVKDVFNSTFVSLLTAFFTLSTTLITLFAMNWKLAILAVITIPLYVIPARRVGKIRWKLTKERQSKLSQLNHIIQETLSISGSTLMKIFTTENFELNKFKQCNQEVSDLQKKEEVTGRWFRMTMHLLTALGPLLVYLLGGLLVIRNEASIGVILVFASLLNRLYSPVMQLSNLHIDTISSFVLFQRIFEYFDKPQEIKEIENAEELVISNGEIEFKNVSFSYGENVSNLKEVSFTAFGGEMTALVGSSGAGKTTITNLIPRLYNCLSGTITIDGQDIQKMTLESLRKQIGIVTQESYLFNGTIAENLLYGCKNISYDEMVEACKAAYIHDFIQTLPNGYETIVGNRGVKLSGGEKQRISIARVILKNPKILILDEATSALDSISENYVQSAMKKLMEGRTSIVIAHRLSTIQSAHQILVMESGSVKESGTHLDLLSSNGMYSSLYYKQFKNEQSIAS